MATRPTDSGFTGAPYPVWATNTNYAGGASVGTPTKADPGNTFHADGWRPNQQVPAQWLNSWMGLVDRWIEYFDSPNAAVLTPYPFASQVITRAVRTTPRPLAANTWDNFGNNCYRQHNLGAPVIVFPLELPHGSVLQTATMYLEGSGHSSLPTMPNIAILKSALPSGTLTNSGNQTDTSASVAAYEANHGVTVTLGGGGLTIDNTANIYFLGITGEDGAGGVVNQLILRGAIVTFEAHATDLGAA